MELPILRFDDFKAPLFVFSSHMIMFCFCNNLLPSVGHGCTFDVMISVVVEMISCCRDDISLVLVPFLFLFLSVPGV